MIPAFSASGQGPAWQQELAQAIRSPEQLLRRLRLPMDLLPAAQRAHERFPLRVPLAFVQRMRKGDPRDPLLLQVLPHSSELEPAPGFMADPVGDRAAERLPGLLHKYHGRVLLVTTGACAIHCRYCFRQHFPYAEGNPRAAAWRASLDYIRNDTSIREVILSGGDPLSLSDDKLAALVRQLEGIGHLRLLRLHTRLPVVLPSRVDEALLAWLAATRLKPVMVIHANHPAEIDSAVAEALARLRAAGVTLLNQSVLLRGINDQAETLAQLSEMLFEQGVHPYYLHALDRVAGSARFECSDTDALALLKALRARLPGYLVPRLVREIPGAHAKLPIEKGAHGPL